MQKFKALLRAWTNLSIDPANPFTLTDTFRMLPSSVAGASGALHRYVSGLLLTAEAKMTYEGEGTPPVLYGTFTQLLDAMLGRIQWTRYGGQFVPQALRASELAVFLIGHGMLTFGKETLLLWCGPWGIDNTCTVRASILIPTTPTMFSTAHSEKPTDSPWPSALLGASSAYTIQGGVGKLPEYVTCVEGLRIEASALCFDTPDAYLARPIEFRKYQSDDDPAVIPTTFAKLPFLAVCAQNFEEESAFAPYMSNIAQPVVRVDGRQLQERMPSRVFQYADDWYRDDAIQTLPFPLITLPQAAFLQQILILRNPFESPKIIEQPAGSKWTVEGIGTAVGGKQKPRYLYTMYSDPDPALTAYQCSQMGIDPSALKLSNMSINSENRAGISLSQEEAIGIPQRLGGTRFE